MDKVIKLYKGDGTPFPSVEEQIVTSDFVYTAKRMGGAPSITCTVRFKDALDDSLDDTVYTVFNDEKYYLRRKPTTSLSNTDTRYKYDIEFISERIILDNVYFLDVVNDPMYKGTSNSTKFTFYGNIGQFAERLNYSLQYSHLDYVVIVDEGVTSEEKNLSFTDQFFSNVLQEIYNTYELPYYFEGKEIHIGTAPMDKHLANIFEYGVDKNLLSITKQSANNKVVNRITGVGSSENIPYYYPNPTPLGEVEIFVRPNGTGLDERNFKISNPELIASRLGLNETLKYTQNLPIKLLSLDAFYRTTENGNWIGAIKEEIQENVFDYWRFQGENIKGEEGQKEATKYRIKFVGTTSGATMNHLSMTWNPDKDYNPFEYADNHTDFNFRLFEDFKAYEKNSKGELQAITATIDGDKSRLIKLPFNGYSEDGEHKFEIQIEYTHWAMPSYTAMRRTDFRNIGIHEGEETTYYWVKESGIRANDIEYFGLETDGEYVTDQWVGVEVGVRQKVDKDGKPMYITPSPNLMPSIYRNSWGMERFYNATNETFKNENGEYYIFTNPYIQGLPKEHIENFDDIKPTINGITNAAGQPFNQFLDIAFDKDDNDSLDENNELVHPYFYVKLPKYNGQHGFNLFDCLNEKGEMTFSMTSGQLGACNFKIAVDKNTNKNDIQVDANGNLVYNEDGRVAIGSPQQRQNDTSANEVWIALFKDIDTYPSVMPNDGASNKPSPKDTFVILNITFPEQYIRAAEERLDDALIQFMYENNVHKFNFSVSLSRIYFEENPEILGKLSENASVLLTYQGHTYRMFVSSFTYKMSGGSILPEISVELADTLSVSHSAADNIINAVKMNIASTISSLDVVGMVSQSFLKKGTDDQAQGRITFNKGLTSKGSASFGTFIPETSGVGIYQDESGNWHFETDYMRVRKKLSATSVEIEEAHHVGGQQLLTSANAAIDYVVERDTFYRCYFLKQDSTGKIVYNKWKVQDQAYCRFFNIDEGDNVEDHYYWRKVVSTSNETKDDTVSFEYDGTVVITSNYHFVDLSKTECDVQSDAPRVSDNIVQLGYQGTDDESRQNAIILAGAGEGSPYIRQYVGINSFTLPNPDTQIKPGDNVFTGKISIQPGSTGLGNTQEWEAAQKDIEQAKTDAAAAKVEAGQISDYAKDAQSKAEAAQAAASQAQQDANDAKQEAEDAKSEASAASQTLDSWAQDNVISPLEKQGVKDEKAFVEADKNDIDKQSERYGIKKSGGNEEVYNTFVTHYNAYLTNLTTIVNSTDDVVAIPDDMAMNQTAYYTARTNLLARIAELAKKVADDAQSTASSAQEAAKAAQEAANVANGALSTLTGDIVAINNRLDGVVENYFLKGSPTIANEPAKSWIDAWVNNQSKDVLNHVGDTYTNVNEFKDANGNIIDDTAGYSWRWCYDNDYTITGNEGKELTIDGTTYKFHWHPIADSDALKALEQAATAQAAADGKCATFLSKPTKPYQQGDLWILENDTVHTAGKTGEILTANTNSAVYIADHWKKLVTYTDNTAFNDFVKNTYNKFVENIQSQVDGKAQTWYQATQPSWTDDDSNHIGDLWYDTSRKKQYVYEGDSVWREIDGVPESVYDTIDGKANIFFTTDVPKYPYARGDMWSQGGDSVLQICHQVTATTEYPQKPEDWEPADNTEQLIEEAKGELEDYTNDVVNGLTSGSQNLVRNGGFTGSYEALSLQSGQSLQSALEMYSPSLEGWESRNAQAENSTTSQTGKRASMWYNSTYGTNGYISQNLSATIKPSTKYVVSFSAYCNQGELRVTFGGITKAFALTNNWKTYHWKMTTATSSSTLNFLKFEATHQVWISDIIVSEGSIPIDWSPSPYDNRSVMAKFQASEYLQEVLKVRTEMDSSSVKTGLVNTGMVLMGDYKEGVLQATTAGLSGTYNDANSVAFFAGGDLEAAIYTAQTYLANPAYQPTEEEIAQMANAVITHGGRAILNQAIVRGDIYADNGYFKGILKAKMIYTEVLHLGDQYLTDGVYTINLDTDPYTTYYCPAIDRGLPPHIEMPRVRDYKGLELSFLTDTGSANYWTLMGAVESEDDHGVRREKFVYINKDGNLVDNDYLALPKSGKMYKFIAMYNQHIGNVAWVALQPMI